MKNLCRVPILLLWAILFTQPALGADFEFRGTIDASDPTAHLLACYVNRFTPEDLFLAIDEEPDETGHFRDLYMDLKGVMIGGVRTDRLTFRMNDVQFNPPSEWAAGNVECRQALQIHAICLLKEDDVNKKLESKTFGKDDHWKDISMRISPDGIRARGIYVAKVLFVTLDILIEVEGSLKIVEGRELWLDNYKIRVNTMDVPDFITQKAIRQIQPLLDLGRFPLPLRLHSVELQKQQAVFSTRRHPEVLQGGITYHYSAGTVDVQH
ncbi:MAG: DUF2993 domain-containing protein [Synergistaceae bacterium]|jgi:hypothetical protein|nr:DUF2993 domain-containing protein [Synergistaceae bacterium]